ncbi:MAG: hypothetical protein M5U31_15905 [Acidimicrobiia bacterium]|nr:hypothetical protein [Acidimicrobiia bacterium]
MRDSSTSPASARPDARPDAATLMAEIEREVRERRRSGDLPADLERDLDRVFESVAPPGAVGTGFEPTLERAERAAFVDPVGPTDSRFPGVSFLRRILRKLLAFYVEHVVRQVSAFGVTLVRSVRLLGSRVSALEARSPALDPRVRQLAAPLEADLDTSQWVPLAESLLGGASGRVLHAECGDGRLAARLAEIGVDIYAVDPRDDAAARADELRVEVRAVEALAHLRALPQGSLGGLVLSGCVDRLPLGDLDEIARLAAGALTAGAPVLVLGVHPGHWARSRTPIAADLAPGHPLHPETWEWLLTTHGFESAESRLGAAPAFDAVPDAASDANFRRIGELLLGPETFAVTARLPRVATA